MHFNTLNVTDSTTIRDFLTGTVDRRHLLSIRAHCGGCGSVQVVRLIDGLGDREVWQDTDAGLVLLCRDCRPSCPVCQAHPRCLYDVEAHAGGSDPEPLDGTICEDCASTLRRRLEDLESEMQDAGETDYPPEFTSRERLSRMRSALRLFT